MTPVEIYTTLKIFVQISHYRRNFSELFTYETQLPLIFRNVQYAKKKKIQTALISSPELRAHAQSIVQHVFGGRYLQYPS